MTERTENGTKNKVCTIIENAVQLTLQQLQILSHMDRNLIHFVKAKFIHHHKSVKSGLLNVRMTVT
jgi:hypothetical protein